LSGGQGEQSSGYTHPENLQPDEHDQMLQIAEQSVSPGFKQRLQEAKEISSSNEISGLWVQAVGDGTPLSACPKTPFIEVTPHQVAYINALDDSLSSKDATEITYQLFAHHLGLVTAWNTETPSIKETQAMIDIITRIAEQYSESLRRENNSLSGDEPLTTQKSRAKKILEEELSYFWLQVASPGGVAFGIAKGHVDESTLGFEIEWVNAYRDYLKNQPQERVSYLPKEFLAQHCLVAAESQGISPTQFANDCLEMATGFAQQHEE
jgi:hypothetical protein